MLNGRGILRSNRQEVATTCELQVILLVGLSNFKLTIQFGYLTRGSLIKILSWELYWEVLSENSTEVFALWTASKSIVRCNSVSRRSWLRKTFSDWEIDTDASKRFAKANERVRRKKHWIRYNSTHSILIWILIWFEIWRLELVIYLFLSRRD